MKVVDLFSGIGGFSLGLERAGMETVAFCEIEKFPRQILAKHWPDVPCYEDVKELTKERLDADGIGSIDVICGGYPCQPFSTAGKRQGQDDDRHLWPEVFRLLQEIRPAWFIGENVAGHISMGLDSVLSDLESEGYAWQPFIIPAVAVDAQHRRDRVWILATNTEHMRGAEQERQYQRAQEFDRSGENGLGAGNAVANAEGGHDGGGHAGENTRQKQKFGSCCFENNVADSDSDSVNGKRLKPCFTDSEERKITGKRQAGSCGDGFRRWPAEPAVGRVANGVPRRVDRLKALGNAVVPQIPEMIGRAIMEIENNNEQL